MEFNHVSVLLDECIENLNIKEDGVYVDCTMGGAGHSKEIVKRLSNKGLFIGFDQDKNAIATAKERLAEYSDRVKFVHSNFENLKSELEKIGVKTIVYTDISKDGMLIGPNFDVYEKLSKETSLDIIASGGVTSMDDVKILKNMNIYGAIIGKALYENKIDLKEVLSLC